MTDYEEFNQLGSFRFPEPVTPFEKAVVKIFPCFYMLEYTDEVGDILVCRIHGNNSRHDVSEGYDEKCLTLDPYPPREST